MDMKNLMLATSVEHELFDGSKVRCTAAMYRVKQLYNRDKKLANLMTKVLANGTDDIFEQVAFLYGAYICANMDSEDLMTEEEFTMMCGSDYTGMTKTVRALIDPKKRMASAKRSN